MSGEDTVVLVSCLGIEDTQSKFHQFNGQVFIKTGNIHQENVRDVSFGETCLCCVGGGDTIQGCFFQSWFLLSG
jgi:hypothetical protein